MSPEVHSSKVFEVQFSKQWTVLQKQSNHPDYILTLFTQNAHKNDHSIRIILYSTQPNHCNQNRINIFSIYSPTQKSPQSKPNQYHITMNRMQIRSNIKYTAHQSSIFIHHQMEYMNNPSRTFITCILSFINTPNKHNHL